MGGELVTVTSQEQSFSFSEVFDKCCGFYLSIGMSYSDYWDGDCEMVKFYRDKNKLDLERKNQELWLLGGYIYNAILNTSPVLNALSKRHEPFPYLEKPVELFPEKEKPENKEQKKLSADRESMMKIMENFNAGFQKRQKKKQELLKEVKQDGD